MRNATVTIDFHNTIINSDAWFQIEVFDLPAPGFAGMPHNGTTWPNLPSSRKPTPRIVASEKRFTSTVTS
ncbi:MAG: hypothetical protein R2843_03650 [Thermomicrobiales bacterium]